jgi:hypothetical protein
MEGGREEGRKGRKEEKGGRKEDKEGRSVCLHVHVPVLVCGYGFK